MIELFTDYRSQSDPQPVKKGSEQSHAFSPLCISVSSLARPPHGAPSRRVPYLQDLHELS